MTETFGIAGPEVPLPLRKPLDINVWPLCLARVGDFVTTHTEFVGLGGPFRPPQSLTLEPCGCTVYIDDWMPHMLVWSDAFTGFLRGCPGLQAGEESDSRLALIHRVGSRVVF